MLDLSKTRYWRVVEARFGEIPTNGVSFDLCVSTKGLLKLVNKVAEVPGGDLPASSDLHLLQTVACCIFILYSQETLSTSLHLFHLQMNMRFAGEQRRERVVREAVSVLKTSCLHCEIPFDPHLWRGV